MLIATLLIGAVGTVAAPNLANPLEPAEHGLMQCWRPDPIRKTCAVIASYRKTGPGAYDNEAIVGLSKQGPVTVETHTPVTLRGDAVCGKVRLQDIQTGILRQGDKVVAAQDAQPILDKVVQVMAPLAGQETCTRYERSGSDFTAKISLEGKYHQDRDTMVKWVSPSDGYTVTP